MKTDPDRLKKLTPYLAVFGLLMGLLFAGTVGEVWYRHQSLSLSHEYLYKYHPTAGFSLNPGYSYVPQKLEDPSKYHNYRTHINSHGFRSRVHGASKRGYRVLMLGDSFTFGQGVHDEETFSWVLEDLLRATPGYEDAEVLNSGTTASSNVSQIAYLKSDGLAYDPDLVVLNLYTGNDFDQNLVDIDELWQCYRYGLRQPFAGPDDTVARAGWEVERGQGLWVHLVPNTIQRVDEWLHGRSFFYRRMSNRLLNLPPVREALVSAGVAETRRLEFTLIPVNVNMAERPELGLRATERLIVDLRNTLAARDMDLLVQVIPMKEEVRVSRVSPHNPERRHNTERLLAFLAENEISGIYLAPVFEKNEYWFDMTYRALHGHFTPEEHELSAASLYRHISDRFLEIPTRDQDRALVSVISENLPFTRPDGFFSVDDHTTLGRLQIHPGVADTIVYTKVPQVSVYRSSYVEFNDLLYRNNLMNASPIWDYYYDLKDQSVLEASITFPDPIEITDVIADVPSVYPDHTTRKLVVFDGETGMPLGGGLSREERASQLHAHRIGRVKELKVRIRQYAGSRRICLRGFKVFTNEIGLVERWIANITASAGS